MNKLYKKHVIKSLLINKEYSHTGNDIYVNINKHGIDLSLNSLIKIINLSDSEYEIKNIKEYFSNYFSQFNYFSPEDTEILLGEIKTKEYLKYLKKVISDSDRMITDYHLIYFNRRKKIYNNINPVKYKGVILEKPIYNHSSVTGRTSIISGHNFLTMKKNERKNIVYHKDGFDLLEVDFKSCEPFFYLLSNDIIKEQESKDVYEYLAGRIGIKKYDRDMFKRGILSLMYGASDNSISKISGLNVLDIEKIKKFLRIKDFQLMIKKEFDKNGCFFNYYGRPILKNHNPVNYWIQSSAVDYCSLAFENFISSYKDVINPCFFIHDSMTFAVKKSETENILKIKKLTDPVSNISIPVTVSLVSNN